MKGVTGWISLRLGETYYTLHFTHRGWLAADLAQYLEDVLHAREKEAAVLKLLGYTMEIGPEAPRRNADHWVEIDVAKRSLETNSDLIRKAVDRRLPDDEDPYSPLALKRLYTVLDRNDFTVTLYR